MERLLIALTCLLAILIGSFLVLERFEGYVQGRIEAAKQKG